MESLCNTRGGESTRCFMEPLPYEVVEAMIQCFGRCFWYKDSMEAFLVQAGVNRVLAKQDRDKAKFVWARNLLTELSLTEDGCLIQRRLLTKLCQLKNVVDKDVADRAAGLEALRSLKRLAVELHLVAQAERETSSSRRQQAEEAARLKQERAVKLDHLHKTFTTGLGSANRQAAGYTLEDILAELFQLFEIEYKRPYRNETHQIDGRFSFLGFDYLVEAKWRKDQPTEKEIAAFQHIVRDKFESTRGLFVSVAGFRDEVVDKFNDRGASIILMDGAELNRILEGWDDLRDVLKAKIEAAVDRGIVYG
jgi:hypothetical protein